MLCGVCVEDEVTAANRGWYVVVDCCGVIVVETHLGP